MMAPRVSNDNADGAAERLERAYLACESPPGAGL
jgi:hypothetical protein